MRTICCFRAGRICIRPYRWLLPATLYQSATCRGGCKSARNHKPYIYQTIRLKSGKKATIVEVLEPNRAYIVDVDAEDGACETVQVLQEEIMSVFVEIEQPIQQVA